MDSNILPPEKTAAAADAVAALPLEPGPGGHCHGVGKDESDWEYEYSATETETYYLTVDLSHADFIQRRDDWYIPNTRGGYRMWFNPMLARKAAQDTNASLFEDDDEEHGDEDEGLPDGEEDDNMEETGPAPRLDVGMQADAARTHKDEEAARVEESLQVLDLHTDRPLLSYRGRVFYCSWADNIGTELLFASPDEARPPLPALRRLAPDADLLAASSARLLTTQAVLRRHTNQARGAVLTRQQKSDRLRSIRREHGLLIPVTEDKTGKRRTQARFLENLMAIKKIKGEADQVTTKTRDTPYDDVDDDPDEMVQRQKKARAQERQRKRTDEIREANQKAGGARGARSRGRGRGRGRGRAGNGWLFRTYSGMDAGAPRSEAVDPHLSTPTPTAWDEAAGPTRHEGHAARGASADDKAVE